MRVIKEAYTRLIPFGSLPEVQQFLFKPFSRAAVGKAPDLKPRDVGAHWGSATKKTQ